MVVVVHHEHLQFQWLEKGGLLSCFILSSLLLYSSLGSVGWGVVGVVVEVGRDGGREEEEELCTVHSVWRGRLVNSSPPNLWLLSLSDPDLTHVFLRLCWQLYPFSGPVGSLLSRTKCHYPPIHPSIHWLSIVHPSIHWLSIVYPSIHWLSIMHLSIHFPVPIHLLFISFIHLVM